MLADSNFSEEILPITYRCDSQHTIILQKVEKSSQNYAHLAQVVVLKPSDGNCKPFPDKLSEIKLLIFGYILTMIPLSFRKNGHSYP